MADLPLILAGPILRRVDATHVCVWIALSEPGDVTVTVFSGRAASTGDGTAGAPSIGSQTRPTRKCGAHLHAVVVDVNAAADGAAADGVAGTGVSPSSSPEDDRKPGVMNAAKAAAKVMECVKPRCPHWLT